MNFISCTHVVSVFAAKTLCDRQGISIQPMDNRLCAVAIKYGRCGFQLREHVGHRDTSLVAHAYQWLDNRGSLIKHLPRLLQTVPKLYMYLTVFDRFLLLDESRLFPWTSLCAAEVVVAERQMNRLTGFRLVSSTNLPAYLTINTLAVSPGAFTWPCYLMPVVRSWTFCEKYSARYPRLSE